MAKSVLLDTGFWIALYEPRDAKHHEAEVWASMIELHNLLIPWPSLYETLNTRFVHRQERLTTFENIIKRPTTILIEDNSYKDEALRMTFEYGKIKTRNYSLVDLVIREILSDTQIRIDYLLTFNSRDFYDICQRRKTEILD